MERKKGVKAEVGIDSHMIQKLLRLFQDLVDLKCCNDVMHLTFQLVHIVALDNIDCICLLVLRSNWQNSHRFVREILEPCGLRNYEEEMKRTMVSDVIIGHSLTRNFVQLHEIIFISCNFAGLSI